MLKLILITFSLFTSLFGVDATQAQMDDIYMEAVMFIGIFGVMGIISYVISSRHAKEYHSVTTPQREMKKSMKQLRIEELYQMYEKEILTFKEYQILEENL